MKLSQVGDLLSHIVKHNIQHPNDKITPMLWGDPGLGKTSITRQVALDNGMESATTILAQYDAGEVGGFPMPDHEHQTMIRFRPRFMPQDGAGIWLLDELPQAPVAVQNLAAQLVCEGRIGEHELGQDWSIVCAGNHPKNRAGTNTMPSHLKDRLLHIDVEADFQDWLTNWAIKSGVRPEIIAYLRYRTEWFHKFDPTNRSNPDPRSWARASNILNMQMTPVLERAAFNGTVGEGAAADFAGFLKVYRELPDPDICLNDPKNAPIPTDAMTMYALCGSLSHRVTQKTMAGFIEYLNRFPQQEFAIFAISDALRRDKALGNTKAYTQWCIKRGADILISDAA